MPRLTDRIRTHQRALTAFLDRRAPGAGEELCQEVWLRVARAAPDCPTDAAFRAYAFAVARRLLVDHHRRRQARVHLVAMDAGTPTLASDATADAQVAADQALAIVEATLAAMKPEIAEVFLLRTTDHVPFADIARIQDVSINTALGRMHQAVGKVRDALRAHGLLPEDAP